MLTRLSPLQSIRELFNSLFILLLSFLLLSFFSFSSTVSPLCGNLLEIDRGMPFAPSRFTFISLLDPHLLDPHLSDSFLLDPHLLDPHLLDPHLAS